MKPGVVFDPCPCQIHRDDCDIHRVTQEYFQGVVCESVWVGTDGEPGPPGPSAFDLAASQLATVTRNPDGLDGTDGEPGPPGPSAFDLNWYEVPPASNPPEHLTNAPW